MTRENKLALVVGFALILLVGILVSDHFSTARRQQSAELTRAVDTPEPVRWEDPELIALRTGQSELPIEPAARDRDWHGSDRRAIATTPRANDPLAGGAPRRIEMGSPVVGLPREQVEQLPYTFHDVERGESLTSICQDYYGDASLVQELAKYNGMEDPDRLSANHRLRIPDASVLVRGDRPGAATPTRSHRAQPTSPRRYTVRKGDNLSTIAQQFLGSAKKYLAIYEHNRDVLDSPNALRPGMVLTIPRRDD
jgi:nucleoid-associated protein YgaU